MLAYVWLIMITVAFGEIVRLPRDSRVMAAPSVEKRQRWEIDQWLSSITNMARGLAASTATDTVLSATMAGTSVDQAHTQLPHHESAPTDDHGSPAEPIYFQLFGPELAARWPEIAPDTCGNFQASDGKNERVTKAKWYRFSRQSYPDVGNAACTVYSGLDCVGAAQVLQPGIVNGELDKELANGVSSWNCTWSG